MPTPETPSQESAELDQVAIDAGLIDASEPNTTAEVVSSKPGDSGEPATPPAATEEGKPQTVLEAVKRAQEAIKAKEAAATKPVEDKKDDAKAETVDDGKAGDKEGKKDGLSREEWKNLSDKAKRRIGNLAREVKDHTGRIADMEPKVRTLDNITTFITTSGITQQEFTDGLELMRLRKQDPAKCYAAMKPIMDELAAHVGDILPADLQGEIDDGRITQEAAKQLVAERNRARLLESQLAQRNEQEEIQRATHQTQQQTTDIHRSISEMEVSWRRTDPDYALKQNEVLERVVFLLQSQGLPQGKEAVMEMVRGAKKTIDDRIASRMPKRSINPVNAQSAAVNASREPKDALEAAKLAVARMRAHA